MHEIGMAVRETEIAFGIRTNTYHLILRYTISRFAVAGV